MAYQRLDDDVLLEIAKELDYRSLFFWSLTSRRHHHLLLNSKQTMLAIVKNWTFHIPLSLPHHISESALTTEDMHLAVQRAFLSDQFWKKTHMDSTPFSPPLEFRENFPGARLLSTVYFHKQGLVLLLLNDGEAGQGGKYLSLYQLFPLNLLTVWDFGEGEVCSWGHDWTDTGGKFKRLVVAASIQRPGWHDLPTRNSLEVRTVDLDDYLSGNGLPTFHARAKCYWRDPFTSVDISGRIVGGLVYANDAPIVLTFMDWCTEQVESILVDAASRHFPPGVEEFKCDVQFKPLHTGYAQVVLLEDWIGLIQLAADGIAGCLLFPKIFSSNAVQPFEAFPPFKSKQQAVAIGITSGTGSPLCIKDRTAIKASGLHEPTKLRVVTAMDIPFHGETYDVRTIDFTCFKDRAIKPEAYTPGFHTIGRIGLESRGLGSAWMPVVGAYAFAVAYMVHRPHVIDQVYAENEQLMILTDQSGEEGGMQSRNDGGIEICVHLPQALKGSIEPVMLDEAAGVVCVQHTDTHALWFLDLFGVDRSL